MLQGRAFKLRFSVSSDFPKPSKINRLQTKKDSIPIAVRWVQPLARIRRNRQRPPSNGSIERARNTAPGPHAFVKKRASDRAPAFTRHLDRNGVARNGEMR